MLTARGWWIAVAASAAVAGLVTARDVARDARAQWRTAPMHFVDADSTGFVAGGLADAMVLARVPYSRNVQWR